MYTIQDLMRILGLTEDQVRERLDHYGPLLRPHLRRGTRNRILLNHSGLEILRHALEYEKSGRTLAEVRELLREELAQKPAAQPPSPETELLTKLLETKEKEIERLEAQLREKDKQIESLHQILYGRLPGEVEASPPTPTTPKTPPDRTEELLSYLQRIIEAQRLEIETLRRTVEQLAQPWWRRLLRLPRRPRPQTPTAEPGEASRDAVA